MNEILNLFVPLTAGVLLGVVFFGGLWWTVRKGLSSDQPAVWFIGSQLLRTGIVLSGFYFTASGQWQRLLPCLFGFVAARAIVTAFVRAAEKPVDAGTEPSHAP
jgi:F1F0 ATPase subunit 2